MFVYTYKDKTYQYLASTDTVCNLHKMCTALFTSALLIFPCLIKFREISL